MHNRDTVLLNTTSLPHYDVKYHETQSNCRSGMIKNTNSHTQNPYRNNTFAYIYISIHLSIYPSINIHICVYIHVYIPARHPLSFVTFLQHRKTQNMQQKRNILLQHKVSLIGAMHHLFCVTISIIVYIIKIRKVNA